MRRARPPSPCVMECHGSSPPGVMRCHGRPCGRRIVRSRFRHTGNAPSRGEARPRPLPPSGRGAERRRPELHSSRPQKGWVSTAGKLLSRLRGRLGGGLLSRQRKRRGRGFRPASPPVRGGGRLPSSFLLLPTGSGSLFRAYPARGRLCAPRRARIAAARLVHLIARARQRAHPSRRLLTGFQKVAPPGRAAPGTRLRMPLPWGPSYHNPPDVKPKVRTKRKITRFFS